MSGVCIIAEVGSVHDGSFGNACSLIELAAKLGADAVKFQTHIPEAETLANAPPPSYFKAEPRFDYFRRTGFALGQWKELKAVADANGIEFLSSPFSIEAVELLENIGMTRYKIPSGEVTNVPMMEVIARTGKPILLSSGMSNWDELDRTIATMRKHHDRITVMQCSSAYPCPNERVGLNVIAEMAARWDLPVGYSDHTMDNHAAFAAVTLGATIVEKHFTFSRAMYGSDAKHSAEPEQFADLVKGIRAIEAMLAHKVDKADASHYSDMKGIFEKSVVSVTDIPAGAVLTPAMLAVKKPGTGIPAAQLESIIGRKTARAIAKDTLLELNDLL